MFKNAVYQVLGIIGVAASALALFTVWISLAVLVVIVLLALCTWIALKWLVGFPIEVKQNGKVVGYVRWFKFKYY